MRKLRVRLCLVRYRTISPEAGLLGDSKEDIVGGRKSRKPRPENGPKLD